MNHLYGHLTILSIHYNFKIIFQHLIAIWHISVQHSEILVKWPHASYLCKAPRARQVVKACVVAQRMDEATLHVAT